MTDPVDTTPYVVCIDDSDYPHSLTRHMIYRTLPDPGSLAAGYYRILDNSNEDYLYCTRRFVPLALPDAVRESLEQASSAEA